MNNSKLFVGNLSWNVTDESLAEFFAQVGEVVEAKVIMDKIKHRSKGFGFVTMKDAAAAAKAIEMLNGKELDGRAVNVSEARPMSDAPRRDNKREF